MLMLNVKFDYLANLYKINVDGKDVPITSMGD